MSPPPSPDRQRRFYKTVGVQALDGGFAVLLDGRPAKTPAGARLQAPTLALAALLAGEWEAQTTQVDLNTMPATRMAFTAIDRTVPAAAQSAREVARYADADVLCYFTEGPASVLEAEVRHWTPVLDWARDALGLEMVRASGVTHRPQPAATLARVEALAAALEPFALTGLVFCAAPVRLRSAGLRRPAGPDHRRGGVRAVAPGRGAADRTLGRGRRSRRPHHPPARRSRPGGPLVRRFAGRA